MHISSNNRQRKPRVKVTLITLKTISKMDDESQPIHTIASVTGLSNSTIYKLLSQINSVKEKKENLLKIILPKGRPREEKSRAIQSELAEVIQEDSKLTQMGMKKKLEDKGMVVSQPRICRLLKQMNYSRKRLKLRPDSVNNPVVIEKRRSYSREIQMIDDNTIVFLDESGINLLNKHYGYSPVGSNAFSVVPTNKGVNVSLLTMISTRGFLAWELVEGSINKIKFYRVY